MEQTCEKCGNASQITLNYGPHYYCKEHFTDFFERRVRKTIRKFGLIKPQEKLLVGVSGGKDSMLVLYLLHKYYKDSNPIEAVIIDEGIPGYRDKAIELAIEGCEQWNIPYTVQKFEKEFGITDMQIMKKMAVNKDLGKSCCAFCGPFRRTILNKQAQETKADKLVTGHNLDDEAQSILMNVMDNHSEKFFRLGAIVNSQKEQGMVPRIKPLYECPEKEIIAYCMMNSIPHYSEKCCPLGSKAKRNDYRAFLNDFELKYPGTKFSVLAFLQGAQKSVAPLTSTVMETCDGCGQPSPSKQCNSCRNLEKLHATKGEGTVVESAGKSCNELKQEAT
ncbi:TIGR00269 family protein [archaeon]|nr:TIGR00269 family protein [archaeon]